MRGVPLLAFLRRAAPRAREIDMLWGVGIPMRDGTHLNATVFRPDSMPSPLPVVFTLILRAARLRVRAGGSARTGQLGGALDPTPAVWWRTNRAKDARTAHVALYHDAAHPSSLELPVAVAQPR